MSLHATFANSQRSRQSQLTALGMIAGTGAVLAAVCFTLTHPDDSGVDGGVPGVLVAGGNHHPTYTPPAVPGMNMGGTVVSTTPTTMLAIEKAVPKVHAGH
jgi:hypothetical protein